MRSPSLFVASFAALGYLGREIYLAAPPIPAAVQVDGGPVLYTADDVQSGQQAWLAADGVVIALILTQIAMGGITAHYAVEGNSFYGFPLADVLPYVVSRTVHTQLGRCGSPPHGWRPGCSSHRCFPGTNPSTRSWASMSCSGRSWRSWSDPPRKFL